MIANRFATRDDIEGLQALLSQYAMRIAPPGEVFTLASGRTSKLFFNAKPVMLSPEGVIAVGNLFLDQCERWDANVVGGLAAGSIPISTAVIACAAMKGKSDIRSFYARSEAKDHGTKEQIYQSFDPHRPGGPVSAGARVLLVDDVLTTGKSIGQAAEVVRDCGADVAALVVLVDRGEGGAAALRERFNAPVVAIYRADSEGALSFHGDEVF